MNRAVNHFAKNDNFEETSFLNEVMENPDLIPEFKHYKVEKGPKYSIEDVSNFAIRFGNPSCNHVILLSISKSSLLPSPPSIFSLVSCIDSSKIDLKSCNCSFDLLSSQKYKNVAGRISSAIKEGKKYL